MNRKVAVATCLLTVITGIWGCENNRKCVPISQCKGVTADILYPCAVNGTQHMVCCPSKNASNNDVKIVPRAPGFPADCGIIDEADRITGGVNAGLGQFPFMALLGYKITGIDIIQFLCGGTLISENYVLTAAHCLNLSGLKLEVIRLGELNLSTESDCETLLNVTYCGDAYQDIPVAKIIPHRKFSTATLKNDIALIKLQKKVTFTEYIHPICLPFDMELRPDMFFDKKFIVSGWGKTSTDNLGGSTALQYAKVTAWTKSRCNKSVPPEVKPIQDKQICANGEKTQDACKGDSGGPLFNVTIIESQFKMYQFGIVSFASAQICGNVELPTVYTRVDSYLNWIVRHAK